MLGITPATMYLLPYFDVFLLPSGKQVMDVALNLSVMSKDCNIRKDKKSDTY